MMRKIIRKNVVELVLMLMVLVYLVAEVLCVSDIGIVFVLRIGTFNIKNITLLLLTVPVAAACIYKAIAGGKSFAYLVSGVWAGTVLCKILGFTKSIGNLQMTMYRDSYTYGALTQVMSSSKLLGRGMEADAVKAVLPEYKTGLMISNIMAQNGIIIGLILVGIIISVPAVILIKSRNIAGVEGVIIKSSCLTIVGMLIINLMMNLRILPYFSATTFMPFVSANIGEQMASIILLGMALFSTFYNKYKTQMGRVEAWKN